MITPDDLFTEEFNVEPPEPLDVFEGNDDQNPDAEEGNGGGEDEAQEVSTVVKPKRVVRNPQPKLNEERLKGSKGLQAVEKHFEKVKYKGKGYEEHDLNTILKTYQYWCHRMFPKFPFDESIAKIEKLGSKKAVQTHMKRMRLGIELEDIESRTRVNDEEDQEQPRDDFDALLGAIEDEPEEINEEQLERMRLNRERAERLKQERLDKARGMAQICLEDAASSIQDAPETSNQISQNQFYSSEEEEDIDMIFHKLNSNKENTGGRDLDRNAESSNPGTSKHCSDNSEEDVDTIFDKLNSSKKNWGSHDSDRSEKMPRHAISKDGQAQEISNLGNSSRMGEPSKPGSSKQNNFDSDSSEEEVDIDAMLDKLNSNKENKPQNEEVLESEKENALELSGEDAD